LQTNQPAIYQMTNITRYTAIGVSLLLIGFLLYTFSSIVAYILIAWVLSMIGQPFMHFFRNKLRFGKFRAGANLSAALTLIIFIIVLGGLGGIFVPLIVEQAGNLMGVDYNEIARALEEPINQLYDKIRSYGISTGIGSPAEQLQAAFGSLFSPQAIGNFFGSAVSAAGNIIVSFFSIIFITFFFLKDEGLFKKVVSTIVPSKHEQNVRNAITETSRMLTRYFGGIIIQMTIITLIIWIGLSILGVKNALLIGFFAALINVIPYVGPLIGAIFAVLLTISSNLDLNFYNEMLPLLLSVFGVFAVMQLVDNFLLQPFIFSNSVLAHPLEIFIVILMGAQINGIVGMVLAIPAYTVLRVIGKNFLSEFRIVKKLTQGM